MALRLLPDQPPPAWSDLTRRCEDLPLGMAGLVRGALHQPGTTAAHLLHLADACDEARKELTLIFPGNCRDADMWAAAAEILRDAAPRYPTPPRLPAVPLTAAEADAVIHHARTRAAGG